MKQSLRPDIAILSYRYNIKHLYNIQIQKYIANKKIIQNYAQMKYKWPVTALTIEKQTFQCDEQP